MEKQIIPTLLLALVLALILGGGLGYFIGYDQGLDNAPKDITSFEECKAAGYPIMESYPEQCATPDGKTFTRQIPPEEQPVPPSSTKPEPVACTMEAKLCPDGTAVGRTGPNCEFAPCPGE